jgi:hypothetical protein
MQVGNLRYLAATASTLKDRFAKIGVYSSAPLLS